MSSLGLTRRPAHHRQNKWKLCKFVALCIGSSIKVFFLFWSRPFSTAFSFFEHQLKISYLGSGRRAALCNPLDGVCNYFVKHLLRLGPDRTRPDDAGIVYRLEKRLLTTTVFNLCITLHLFYSLWSAVRHCAHVEMKLQYNRCCCCFTTSCDVNARGAWVGERWATQNDDDV
ncbi:hypothetical protein V1509DRAFT_627971 [Lipomyces kononenkoae]